MATSYYESFIKKLKEIFMMDHAELDFGIYRIMNQKRSDIQAFLEKDLLPQVKQLLAENNSAASALNDELKQAIQACHSVGINPDESPKVMEIKKRMAASADITALENEVYSHLTTFFSRYYDEGDFISKRRYKDNTYAIPYNGEEVKLYWANADQYYIKTSEYFKNYTFRLADHRSVHFVLKEASTEQNNNKAQNNQERRFALYEEEGEPTVEVIDGELNIYFTYELMPKATKQKDLNSSAVEKLKSIILSEWAALMQPVSNTDSRLLIEKHLTDYTAKNSFDYFIHKDLGGFLRRELDFYIKNEVMHLDDLDTAHIQAQLSTVKAIKGVGDKIIRMLASIEDFQKKLWLKKKFVVQTDYCITLDRVPKSLYADICANEEQRKEWVRLFAIGDIEGNLTTEGYSEPLTEKFLKENPFLVLDTQFFSAEFKHKLLASIDNMDEKCNGLLINSENFQALELLKEKYAHEVRCVYIDPPYNIGSDNSFAYKDNYKYSSWLSMMYDRLVLGKIFLKQKSNILCGIGPDMEGELRSICNSLEYEKIYPFIWKSRAKPTNTGAAKLRPQVVGEFVYMLQNDKEQNFNPISSGIERKYNNHDEYGNYRTTTILTSNLGRYKRETMRFTIGAYTPPYDKRWKAGYDEIKTMYDNHCLGFNDDGEPFCKIYEGSEDEQHIPFWTFIPEELSSTAENGKNELSNIIPNHGFDTVKPKELLTYFLSAITSSEELIFDYFAGSGTTAHAVIEQNKEDNGKRKYLMVDMGDYFKRLLFQRIEKVIYSSDWQNGKPVSRQGISQCFKYIRLEQYEDTLNNLVLKEESTFFNSAGVSGFKESYMLGYMMDTESCGSLFNLEWFVNPFAMTLKTTKDNELVETPVDMVETFNFLIGLYVETEHWHNDGNICVVEGVTHRNNEKTLVIWRNCEVVDNQALNRFFEKMDYSTLARDFDVIYVNGDNTLPNLRRDEDRWKVVLIEEEFKNRMFEEE